MATYTHPLEYPTSTHLKKALVVYDGDCPLCQKSVRLLRGLDWLNVLAFIDARDPDQVAALPVPVEAQRLLEEMHLVTPDGQHVYHGFEAFRWLAWRLPLLWAVAPLLYLPGMKSLGQRAYLSVAQNRLRLVPCHGGVCTLPRS